jgi:hypothetical protein
MAVSFAHCRDEVGTLIVRAPHRDLKCPGVCIEDIRRLVRTAGSTGSSLTEAEKWQANEGKANADKRMGVRQWDGNAFACPHFFVLLKGCAIPLLKVVPAKRSNI